MLEFDFILLLQSLRFGIDHVSFITEFGRTARCPSARNHLIQKDRPRCGACEVCMASVNLFAYTLDDFVKPPG